MHEIVTKIFFTLKIYFLPILGLETLGDQIKWIVCGTGWLGQRAFDVMAEGKMIDIYAAEQAERRDM